MGNPSRSTKIVSSHKLIIGQILYAFGSHFLTTLYLSRAIPDIERDILGDTSLKFGFIFYKSRVPAERKRGQKIKKKKYS